jgi:hypothetical protein
MKRPMDQGSQNERIAAWLRAGKKISPLIALEKFGSFRLGARIHQLKAAGMPIVTERVTDKRTGKSFAEYRLEKS